MFYSYGKQLSTASVNILVVGIAPQENQKKKKKSLLRVHASNLYTHFEYKVFREDFKLKGNFHHASNFSSEWHGHAS